MTRTTSRLLIAALIAAAGTLAATQSALAQPGGGRDPAVMQQRMAERHAQRMANLKALLNITAQQEAAWSAFAAAMQPPALPARMSQDELNNMTAPQRIELRQQLMAEREARMKQRGEAIKTFYANLTPEQQKTFDQHMAQARGRAMQRGPGSRN